MHGITDADREAANALREVLANVSGFWHNSHDDSALCRALARHRAEAEERLLNKLTPLMKAALITGENEIREHTCARLEGEATVRPGRLAG